MRVAIIALVALAGMGVAAYLASKRLVVEQKPLTPAADVLVEVPQEGLRRPPSQVERDVAVPLEEALAKLPGVTRLRMRTTTAAVTAEVWGAESSVVEAALKPWPRASARRNEPKLETYWVFRGDERPQVIGQVCGREEPMLLVHIDPQRLKARQVGALLVDRAARRGSPEEVEKLEIAEQVRLSDVARVEIAPPPPKCIARTPEGPSWFVRTLQQELGTGPERVANPTRVELRANGNLPDKLTVVEPKVVTFEPPAAWTLWFSPALGPAQRGQVLGELRALPGVQVRHIDGLPRVRVVLSGADREQLLAVATRLGKMLELAQGVQLVVTPPAVEPFLDVKVDRERAAAAGVPVDEVAAVAELALQGREHDGVRVSVELQQREHMAALFVRDRRLSDLVTLVEVAQPFELMREDRKPAVEVLAYGIDSKAVPMLPLPAGVTLEIHEEL